MKRRVKTFRERQNIMGKKLMSYFQKESLLKRFQVKTTNEKRLNGSLVLGKSEHLIDRTLLSTSVHKQHSDGMFKKLKSMCRGVNPSSIRFVTILDSLEILDDVRCMQRIKDFRKKLTGTTGTIRGLQLIGAIECEVVSPPLMRKIYDQSETEQRKLDVLESLLRRCIKRRDLELSCYFLIHFHGVAVGKQNVVSSWAHVCREIWKHDPRQVRVQELSESWGGKPKPVRESLQHIARYITKGGNAFMAGKSYLKYKIGFENTDTPTEEEWTARNWRRNEVLKQERIEEGIEDVFSLSVGEICQLARVIDKMMGMHPKRTGYVIDIKTPIYRKRHI